MERTHGENSRAEEGIAVEELERDVPDGQVEVTGVRQSDYVKIRLVLEQEPWWRKRNAPLIARMTESTVPPTTSTLRIVVGFVARLSSPISPAGTVNPISTSLTCPAQFRQLANRLAVNESDKPMGVLVTAVVCPSKRNSDPFVVVRSYVNWSNALQTPPQFSPSCPAETKNSQMLRVARSNPQRRNGKIQPNRPARPSSILLQQRRLCISHRRLERRYSGAVADDRKLVGELNDIEGEAKGETEGR